MEFRKKKKFVVGFLPIGPSSPSNGGWCFMWRNMGRRNAKVFPLPVLAIPIISLPERIMGNAWAWIGVGFS